MVRWLMAAIVALPALAGCLGGDDAVALTRTFQVGPIPHATAPTHVAFFIKDPLFAGGLGYGDGRAARAGPGEGQSRIAVTVQPDGTVTVTVAPACVWQLQRTCRSPHPWGELNQFEARRVDDDAVRLHGSHTNPWTTQWLGMDLDRPAIAYDIELRWRPDGLHGNGTRTAFPSFEVSVGDALVCAWLDDGQPSGVGHRVPIAFGPAGCA